MGEHITVSFAYTAEKEPLYSWKNSGRLMAPLVLSVLAETQAIPGAAVGVGRCRLVVYCRKA